MVQTCNNCASASCYSGATYLNWEQFFLWYWSSLMTRHIQPFSRHNAIFSGKRYFQVILFCPDPGASTQDDATFLGRRYFQAILFLFSFSETQGLLARTMQYFQDRDIFKQKFTSAWTRMGTFSYLTSSRNVQIRPADWQVKNFSDQSVKRSTQATLLPSYSGCTQGGFLLQLSTT